MIGLTISNGRVFGGGLPIAPDADLEDGLLDACAIADASPLGRARLFGLAVTAAVDQAQANMSASRLLRESLRERDP